MSVTSAHQATQPGAGDADPDVATFRESTETPASAWDQVGRGAQQPLEILVDAIRRDLADGAYNPRERLVEADLVARYGASRAAVREALIQLATEGLIERAPNRGARVRGMSPTEAIEIAEVRRALECLSVARAATRATPTERAAILALARSLRDAALANDVGGYLRLNARFHQSIQAMAGHATVQGILAKFQSRPIDRFFPEPFLPVPPTASVDAHVRIAEAIAGGEPDAAQCAMHDHLTDLIEVLRRFGEQSADRPGPASGRSG